MQKEKIAIIGLVIIVVCAISAFLILAYGEDIMNNLFGSKKQEVLAKDDSLSVYQDSTNIINIILHNDRYSNITSYQKQVQILLQASNGIVNITADNQILYTPNTNFSGNDSFVYEITDENGQKSQATVTLQVNLPGTIALGDCVDINYIGRYASNGTIFDSSYKNTINKTSGVPLQIYVTLNKTAYPPEGYEYYSQGYIEGLIEGLVGLKQGETKNLTIPPEKAYGVEKKVSVGDIFSTTHLTESLFNHTLNQTLEVIDLNDENITLKWLNVQNLGNFTIPEYILVEDLEQAYYTGMIYDNLPPYYIWENSSMVINVTDTSVLIKTTPTKTQNLTNQVTPFVVNIDQLGFIFPDATTAEWNETKIIIKSSPLPGSKYKLDYMGMVLNITVENVTENNINVSVEFKGKIEPYEINRTIEFNRTYLIRRIYVIPMMFAQYIIEEDLHNAGLSLNKLSGEELIFEVKVEKVYKFN
ncbi:MAG: Ig-like domain-containing protein [Candidatus Thermoplasmatota archaeon]|jgi:FKBP-type peptidyl-prolyl cis-trans isomerase 2|nr:Ig-like domain-containing protein [Candidatus Thermoplasmatota archaeon]